MVTPVRQIYRLGETLNDEANTRSDHANLPSVINRDLSLLEFFRRVLGEAADPSQPLLERLKFVSIFSSNIDEFFMIRVSALKEKVGRQTDVFPDGYTRQKLLDQIRAVVEEMTKTQMRCLTGEILPELNSAGIGVKRYGELADSERRWCDLHFDEKIYQLLTPQAVDPTHPFPYISGGSINLGVFIKPKLNRRVSRALGKSDEFFVRVKIPAFLTRFVQIDDDSYIPVEEIIRANIAKLLPDADPASCHHFRITRDADLDLRESEAEDLLETMEENLKLRRFGDVVRLEIGASMPEKMAGYLTESLEIGEDDVYRCDGPLKGSDFWQLVNLNRPDLKEPPIGTETPAIFGDGESKFDAIRRGDVLLHHPYMPYGTVTDLLTEAVDDPDVLAIKICLYRIGEDSPIAPLLMKASERGKQVTALIEIKARFDEENNIEWGKQLERAGVHVVYGLLGLKTHAKTTLIIRRENDELKTYVHLATGNYNPATSTVYTDLGLLTADADIGKDVSDLFNYLTAYSQPKVHRKLLMAPLNLREQMLSMIAREAENAREGKPARIIAKINRVADAQIVDALYEASKAGVEIDMIVRGICTLRPGLSGLSENIRVRSVVGRLLEHSRVYYFENGGEPEIFIGSSDWMPRNLDRRVEVLAPISDPGIRGFLRDEYLASYLKDNAKAHELMPDGTYTKAADGGDVFDSQLEFQPKRKTLDFSAARPDQI